MLILLKTFSYNLKKFDVHLSLKRHSAEQSTDDNNSDYSDRQQVNHDHHWFAKAHFNEFSWANTVEKKVNLKKCYICVQGDLNAARKHGIKEVLIDSR